MFQSMKEGFEHHSKPSFHKASPFLVNSLFTSSTLGLNQLFSDYPGLYFRRNRRLEYSPRRRDRHFSLSDQAQAIS